LVLAVLQSCCDAWPTGNRGGSRCQRKGFVAAAFIVASAAAAAAADVAAVRILGKGDAFRDDGIASSSSSVMAPFTHHYIELLTKRQSYMALNNGLSSLRAAPLITRTHKHTKNGQCDIQDCLK
jgi:hypothetical protein